MRRIVSCIGLCLLALLVSGWGSMLAAAFCPHAGATLPQAVLAEEQSGCHAKSEQTEDQHSGSRQSSSSEAMHGMKAGQMPALRLHVDKSNVAALTLPAGTCTHCVSHNETPPTPASARGLTLQKRDAGKIIAQTTTPISLPMVFTAQFAPTQHAPPGLTNHRHILLSVFLI
jgi:hypothetical protein